MKIIPAIDLLNGQVVHARLGQRSLYRPLQSILCQSAEPMAVITALLDLHPFGTMYLADLSAILRTGSEAAVIRDIVGEFSNLEFWIDRGIPAGQLAPGRENPTNIVPVIGSESLDTVHLEFLAAKETPLILSLDYRDSILLGPERLLELADLWPSTVIAMSLSHVGSQSGPDFRLLEQVRDRCHRCRIAAAGGVRDLPDLERLKEWGASAALIASALHSGSVGSTELTQFAACETTGI